MNKYLVRGYKLKYKNRTNLSAKNLLLLKMIKSDQISEQERKELMEKLFELNKSVILKEINILKLEGSILSHDDFIGYAYEVLDNCVKNYEINYEVAFSTYLTVALKNKFQRIVETLRSNINLPVNTFAVTNLAIDFLHSRRKKVDAHSIAALTGFSEKRCEYLLLAKRWEKAMSIYEPVMFDEEDQNYLALYEKLIKDEKLELERTVLNKLIINELLQFLEKKDKLKADIIKLYFGLTEDKTELSLKEIAKIKKISYERARHLMKRALTELREMIEE